MARYTGPKVRVSRRLTTNIFENEKGRKALDRRPFPEVRDHRGKASGDRFRECAMRRQGRIEIGGGFDVADPCERDILGYAKPMGLKSRHRAERQLVAGIEVFDVYEGAGIEPDKKSVAIAVTLQPTEKTLTEAEIEAVSQKIVGEVAKKTGAVLRG